MNNALKAVLVVVVLGAITYLGMTYPKFILPVGSAVGTTFNSAKVAAVNMTISTASATSSSLFNNDGSTRYITDSFASCSGVGSSKTAYTGAGLASLVFDMATTSTNAPAILSNTNYAAAITVSTSTTVSYVASSTEGIITGWSRVWPDQTYLTIQPNATNTAACVVGVHYLAS